MDHSVLGFSHEMRVLIERSTEIAIGSFQLLQKVMVLLQLTPQNSQIGAPLSPSKQPCNGLYSSGLSSAGSALVESSNCKVFCTQQRHVLVDSRVAMLAVSSRTCSLMINKDSNGKPLLVFVLYVIVNQ